MKLRIQDNSLRIRISLRELEELLAAGKVSRTMQILGPDGLGPQLQYSLEHAAALPESIVTLTQNRITVHLSSADRDELIREDAEGVYLRREWTDLDGGRHRFMAFVEKDRPAATCRKIEQWIYDDPPHGPCETRPIPRRAHS